MARYRQGPNYIAKKSLWLALNWWNVLFNTILIPAVIAVLTLIKPDIFSWYVFAILYALVPLTIICVQKKLSVWNLLIFIILIPGTIAGMCLLLPPIAELLNTHVFSNGWVALGVWLVFPFSIYIVKIIILKHKYIEFYDTFVIERTGVFVKHTKKTVFPEVTAVTTKKNILGYGDVYIDVVGPWDITFDKMARPDDLRDYLVYHMLNSAAVENISNNPYIAATDGIF